MPGKRVGLAPVGATIAFIGALLALAPLAGGAPTPAAPPAIEGFAGYQSKLTCTQGTWSPDAVSFSFEWLQGGSFSVGTGTTYTTEVSDVGRSLVCRVTATDAAGGSTSANSAPVTVEPGKTKLSVSGKKTQEGRKLKLSGKVSPADAFKATSSGRKGGVVAYRVTKAGLLQLFPAVKIDSKGRFKVVAKNEPTGKHTYQVNFNPNEPTLWAFGKKTLKVTIKK